MFAVTISQVFAVVTTCACLRVAEWPRIEWAIAPEVGVFSVQLRPAFILILAIVDGVSGYTLDNGSVFEQPQRVFNAEKDVWIPANVFTCVRNQAVNINKFPRCMCSRACS